MIGYLSFDAYPDKSLDDEFGYVEGAFKIGDNQWKILGCGKDECESIQVFSQEFSTGYEGLSISFPIESILNKRSIQEFLKMYLNVDEMKIVNGPDSFYMRAE